MSNSNITISVVMPAWNAQETIERAIRSALDQKGVEVEILVLDDCSTDNTSSIVSSIEDSRVKYRRMKTNGGPAAARNEGIRLASGEFIAVLDSDDYFLPDRLERLGNIICSHNADVAVDNLVLLRHGSGKMELFFQDQQFDGGMVIELDQYLRENTLFDNKRTLGYLKPVFKTKFLRERNLLYNENVKVIEDFVLVAECLARGAHLLRCWDAGYVYTVDRSGSFSNRLNASWVATMISADDTFMRTYVADMTPAQIAAARFRRRNLDRVFTFLSSLEAVKLREFRSAIAMLLKSPSSIGYFKMPMRARLKPISAKLKQLLSVSR